jgi:tRNA threonylcarbamoyladenosine biosynthesis protein TsaB
MMELAIETSTRYASVALSLDGHVLQEATWRAGQNHSVELAPAVQRLLEAAHAAPADLKAVFVAKGPGGFSALRVGMSFAKSLAVALRVPLVTVGTLDIEAAPYRGLGLPVWAVLDAGRARWYAARYPEGHAAEAPDGVAYRVLTTDELAAEVRAPALLCGEDASKAAEAMPQGVVVASMAPPTRRAGTLARLAYARLSRGSVDDPVTAQPLYLRGSQYEVAAGGRQHNKIS